MTVSSYLFLCSVLLFSHSISAMERMSVQFKSQGSTVAAHLYLPANITGPIPVLVSSPGFAGVKEILFPDYAPALADIGIATFVFDPIGFGESGGDNRQEIDIPQQLQTFKDAIDFVEQDSRFDPKRIGAFGMSLSGGHTLHVAGTDSRIKAGVAIIPHVKISLSAGVTRVNFALDIATDLVARYITGGTRTMIAVSGPPGSKAAMNEEGSVDFLAQMSKDAPTYKNEVTANSLLSMARYDNTAAARKITIPVLVISANNDTITPGSVIHSTLDQVQSVRIKDFPGRHFEVLGEKKRETISLTVEWFQTHLKSQGATGLLW